MRTMNHVDGQIVSAAPVAGSDGQVAAKGAQGGRALRAHRIVARGLLGAIALQFFFAGLGVFGAYSFVPHSILGPAIILTSISLPIIAWRGRLERSRVWRSWLLFALMIVQGALISLWQFSSIVAAFHPMNAMILALLTFSLI